MKTIKSNTTRLTISDHLKKISNNKAKSLLANNLTKLDNLEDINVLNDETLILKQEVSIYLSKLNKLLNVYSHASKRIRTKQIREKISNSQ